MTAKATIEMTTQPIAPEDEVRAHLYALLGNLLLQVPDQSTLDQLSALQGDEGEVGSVINTLSQLATSMTADAVEREYNILFIGAAGARCCLTRVTTSRAFSTSSRLLTFERKCAVLAFGESKESLSLKII